MLRSDHLPGRSPRRPRRSPPSSKSSASLVRAACGLALGAVLVGCNSSTGSGPPILEALRPTTSAVGPGVSGGSGGSEGPPVAVEDGSAVPGQAAGRDVGQDLTAAAVLRSWDAARSRAFATGDVAALRALYVAGSPVGTSDVRLLRAYLRRGLRVEEMRMQVLGLEVLDERDRRLRVRVTDRLAGAVAVGEDGRWPLPRDRASTRVVELRRVAGEWRVRSVRE